MISFDANQVDVALEYNMLIPKLLKGFVSEDLDVPRRHHHDYPNPPGDDSTLLMMPAWKVGNNVGVKIVNVTPENGKLGLPSIHGIYLFFEAGTGQPLALMDSDMITKKRTAATSALASKYLSREESSTMLMVGTGVLAPEMIKAHCEVRNISRVLIWGRDKEKALNLCKTIEIQGIEILPVDDLEDGVQKSDIISTATLSKVPLIKGKWLKPGQHVDLVGSYKPDMREADDMVIKRSSLFIDSYQGAPYESGDLVLPIKNNIISIEDIKADLFELCRNLKVGRTSDHEITCFKSVGHALEDLVAAQLVYDRYLESINHGD